MVTYIISWWLQGGDKVPCRSLCADRCWNTNTFYTLPPKPKHVDKFRQISAVTQSASTPLSELYIFKLSSFFIIELVQQMHEVWTFFTLKTAFSHAQDVQNIVLRCTVLSSSFHSATHSNVESVQIISSRPRKHPEHRKLPECSRTIQYRTYCTLSKLPNSR